MINYLEEKNLIEKIPNLLGCDLYYDSMDEEIKEYRTNGNVYTGITESIRAETLEDGPVSDENIFMLCLFRESACFQEIFSNKELEEIAIKMNELSEEVYLAKVLFKINIYHGVEIGIRKFLKSKKSSMQTPTGIGLNFVFPWLERSQSIFIDTEEWFPNSRYRTLKFYTEEGLLPFKREEEKLTRRFPRERVVERIEEIKVLKMQGHRIDEIKKYY